MQQFWNQFCFEHSTRNTLHSEPSVDWSSLHLVVFSVCGAPQHKLTKAEVSPMQPFNMKWGHALPAPPWERRCHISHVSQAHQAPAAPAWSWNLQADGAWFTSAQDHSSDMNDSEWSVNDPHISDREDRIWWRKLLRSETMPSLVHSLSPALAECCCCLCRKTSNDVFHNTGIHWRSPEAAEWQSMSTQKTRNEMQREMISKF